VAKALKNLVFAAAQHLQQIRPLSQPIEPTLLEQAEPSLLQLLFGNHDVRNRLAGHHLLHQGLEQVEAIEQGQTLSTDCSLQLRNNCSAIHKPDAMGEN
jgi:hypothetical protein